MSCLVVKRRHVRTDPFYDDETGEQIGWYTKPADWYIARSTRTRYGVTYTYDGLEKEHGFKTKREAKARRDQLTGRPGRINQ